jgi:hypothetical protein
VGSVAGQRYWSTMLPPDVSATCGVWTPDDQQARGFFCPFLSNGAEDPLDGDRALGSGKNYARGSGGTL